MVVNYSGKQELDQNYSVRACVVVPQKRFIVLLSKWFAKHFQVVFGNLQFVIKTLAEF